MAENVTLPQGFVLDETQTELPPGFTVDEQKQVESREGFTGLAVEAAKNLPSSTIKLLNNIGLAVKDVVTDPLGSAQGLGNIAFGLAEKIIPGEQEHEQYLEPIIDFYKQRYGSLEGLNKSIAEDPAGVMADVATMLTGAGGAVRGIGAATQSPKVAQVGRAIQTTGQAMEPVSIATTPIAAIPKKVPEWMYQSGVKFSTGKQLMPSERNMMARVAIDNNIPPTRRGLEMAWNKVSDLANKVDGIIDDLTAAGKTVDMDRAISALDDFKNEINANFFEPQPYIKAINKLEDNIKRAHGKKISARKAQNLKQGVYKEIKQYYAPGKTDVKGPAAARAVGKKKIAAKIRESLIEKHPEIANLSAEEGSLLKLIEALEQPVKRIENRDIFGLGATVKTGVGEAIGQGLGIPAVGGATGFALGMLDNPKIKPRLAIVLDKARKAARRQAGVKTRLTAEQAARLQQETE
jgi:hypothetical protein